MRQTVPEQVPEKIPGQVPEKVREKVPGQVHEEVLEKVREQVPKQTKLQRRVWTAKRFSEWRFVLLGTFLGFMPLIRPKYNHTSQLHLSSQRHRDTEP